MRLTVVGNPDNRRVTGFRAAAERAGRPCAVLPWHDVVAGGPLPLGPADTVRVESPGEDARVDRALRGVGLAPGEIGASARWYAGFGAALRRVAATGCRLLNPVDDVLTMCDKAATHRVLAAAGVPVAEALPARDWTGWTDVRGALDAAGWRRAFVKPRHASSASGVLALCRDGRGRTIATTSAVRHDGRLYNSLRVRRYDDEREVAALVDALAPDGLHVERWFPKAGLAGRTVDLRVVVIAGVPSHLVLRAATSPMTNLHLGAVRGDPAALRAAMGETGWAAAMATCAAAAGCFPGSLHVAVDLMVRADLRAHAVAECNAFGDLLPGVLAGGADTYTAEVGALR